MQTSAQWIAEAVSGRLVGPDVLVTGPVVTDSREAAEGSLSIAARPPTGTRSLQGRWRAVPSL